MAVPIASKSVLPRSYPAHDPVGLPDAIFRFEQRFGRRNASLGGLIDRQILSVDEAEKLL